MRSNHHPEYQPYPASRSVCPQCAVCVVATAQGDRLLVEGDTAGFTGDRWQEEGEGRLLGALDHHNAQRLRALFPHTRPRPGLHGTCSIGAGDRLGVAAAGHLRAFSAYPGVFPVLAQQSIRELNLTGRDYSQVLDAATFAVFKAGWCGGFGADGDHLKKPEEVAYALACGFSMITLDCSGQLHPEAASWAAEEVLARCQPGADLAERYLKQPLLIPGMAPLKFTALELARCQTIYGDTLDFIKDIFDRFISGQALDFEISIDETTSPTTPLQHAFVASELRLRGVGFVSLAPRFCGEFQKGIDYAGDLERFEMELGQHAAIARHYGYKLSVHSGSDKFLVFPAVGRLTRGVFHLKTAGTSWLEAVRLVAKADPALYRAMHRHALEHFSEAAQYYHVSADLTRIPRLESLRDEELPGLMEHPDARQLLHITYGLLLTTKDAQGGPLFRDRLYALLDGHSQAYESLLETHFKRHLAALFGSQGDENHLI